MLPKHLGQRVVVMPANPAPQHRVLLTLQMGSQLKPGQVLWCSATTPREELNRFLQRVEQHRYPICSLCPGTVLCKAYWLFTNQAIRLLECCLQEPACSFEKDYSGKLLHAGQSVRLPPVHALTLQSVACCLASMKHSVLNEWPRRI